jgi:DNA repair ATPase RecN
VGVEKGPLRQLDNLNSFKTLAFEFAEEAHEAQEMREEAEAVVSGAKRKIKEVLSERDETEKKLEKENEKLKRLRKDKKKEHDLLLHHRRTSGEAQQKLMEMDNMGELKAGEYRSQADYFRK